MVNPMKLNVKMTLLFSVIMAVATLLFSSYTVQTSVDGAQVHTKARFANMSTSIARDLEQEIHMMTLTLDELVGNTAFMAALNQYVRDDSDDQKTGNAARIKALQQLYQSPLVERFYRVSFIGLDGSRYLSSLTDKDPSAVQPPEDLLTLYSFLNDDHLISIENQYSILPPHPDMLNARQDIYVYGIAQTVYYHGKALGAISILNEYNTLNHIMSFIDNAEVEVHAIFDNGSLLFSSTDETRSFPVDLPEDEMHIWTDQEHDTELEVYHTSLKSLKLNLYIAQDRQHTITANKGLRNRILKRAFFIMLPSIALITMLAFGLTRSIRKLTRKVKQVPAEAVLSDHFFNLQTLTDMVTSPGDPEIYTLEQTYNHMMLRLRDSMLKELSLREGTLQAQLSALQTQINPHFIYNTLNIISAKSMESGNFEIIEICDQFASMLRYSTDTSSRTATMEDEIEHIRNYLMLAKARYEENLEFTIDVPNDLKKIEVPKLTLQPLVENALNHGYDGINVQRILSVTGKIQNEELILEIRDNGTGFSAEILKDLRRQIDDIHSGKGSIEKANGHIGLINTCLRLHYYSKGNIRVSIRNDHGAVTTITMPAAR